MFSIGIMEILVLLAILGAGVVGIVILFLIVRALTKPRDE